MAIKVWLDDIRPPHKFGRVGWTWAKTYEAAIELLKTGEVEAISLDHDLAPEHYLPDGHLGQEKTGYHVCLWMEENKVFPEEIYIHSLNPVGRERMSNLFKANNVRCRMRVALI